VDTRAHLRIDPSESAARYSAKKARLEKEWKDEPGQLRLAKSTISNLFRYADRDPAARRVSLASFNGVINVDTEGLTLEAEGLCTYETAVAHTLAHGLMPLVAPELKHITIGGAIVGIGIESTCFENGFVHDGLIEADVLLPGGKIVTCTAENEYGDLFAALPNSYGTLGYVLRAKMALKPAAPYVHMRITRFEEADAYLEGMRQAVEAAEADFIEGLFYEDRRFFLMTGELIPNAPATDDIVRENIFYRLVEQRRDIYLTTKDYLFRYDPDWFWNVPESWPYTLFRRYAPLALRNSSSYTKYTAIKERLTSFLPGKRRSDMEPLIQDWQVPWERAAELVEFCLSRVRLDGRPWAAVPIRTQRQPTLYPIRPGQLYFNLGCYCQVRRPPGEEPYHYTKIMDRECFELGGIKMLYSSSFLPQEEFDTLYNGQAYRALKAKYDPESRAKTLYAKVNFSAA
jgi:FAD/FMN-containing dehydrogenase